MRPSRTPTSLRSSFTKGTEKPGRARASDFGWWVDERRPTG